MDNTFVTNFSFIKMSDFLFSAGFLLGTSMFLVQAWKHIQTKEQSLKSMISYLVLAVLNANGITYFFRHGDTYAMMGSILQSASLMANVGVILWARWTLQMHVPSSSKMKHAFIFDLDGTLFDTQTPVHAAAETEVLAEIGIKVTPKDISARFAGISTKKVFQELAPSYDPEKLLQRKWEIVREKIDIPQKPLAGMYELLSFLKSQNASLAIASASPKWYIERLLEHSIKDHRSFKNPLKNFIFEKNCVSAEEVLRGKPAPDIFLLAAERLGKTPQDCIVIGDGHSDVHGGLAADMKVIFLGSEAIPGNCTAHLFNGTLVSFSSGEEVNDFVQNGCFFPKENV